MQVAGVVVGDPALRGREEDGRLIPPSRSRTSSSARVLRKRSVSALVAYFVTARGRDRAIVARPGRCFVLSCGGAPTNDAH